MTQEAHASSEAIFAACEAGILTAPALHIQAALPGGFILATAQTIGRLARRLALFFKLEDTPC